MGCFHRCCLVLRRRRDEESESGSRSRSKVEKKKKKKLAAADSSPLLSSLSRPSRARSSIFGSRLSAATVELVVPARATPTQGAIEAVGESLCERCFFISWIRKLEKEGVVVVVDIVNRSNAFSQHPFPFNCFIRSHLREEDIVALLVAEEEEAWEPRERFIFAIAN